jgi:hypothetical protein
MGKTRRHPFFSFPTLGTPRENRGEFGGSVLVSDIDALKAALKEIQMQAKGCPCHCW